MLYWYHEVSGDETQAPTPPASVSFTVERHSRMRVLFHARFSERTVSGIAKLTEKQKRFADEYLIDLNAAPAGDYSPALLSQYSAMNRFISVVGVVPLSAHFFLNASNTSGFRSSGKRT